MICGTLFSYYFLKYIVNKVSREKMLQQSIPPHSPIPPSIALVWQRVGVVYVRHIVRAVNVNAFKPLGFHQLLL